MPVNQRLANFRSTVRGRGTGKRSPSERAAQRVRGREGARPVPGGRSSAPKPWARDFVLVSVRGARRGVVLLGVVACVGVPARAWASVGVAVPQVGSSLSAAYAVLHERGLVVSLPAVVIGGDRVPVVAGVVPRAGLVVARGATARLRVRWARRRSGVRARPGVVPGFVGSRASAVAGRARRGGVHVILRLGALTAGGAQSLLEN